MVGQLRRIVTLLSLIPRQPEQISVRQLIDGLQQRGFAIGNRRQVERDLVALAGMGFPLLRSERRPSGWAWAAAAPGIEIPCDALRRSG